MMQCEIHRTVLKHLLRQYLKDNPYNKTTLRERPWFISFDIESWVSYQPRYRDTFSNEISFLSPKGRLIVLASSLISIKQYSIFSRIHSSKKNYSSNILVTGRWNMVCLKPSLWDWFIKRYLPKRYLLSWFSSDLVSVSLSRVLADHRSKFVTNCFLERLFCT